MICFKCWNIKEIKHSYSCWNRCCMDTLGKTEDPQGICLFILNSKQNRFSSLFVFYFSRSHEGWVQGKSGKRSYSGRKRRLEKKKKVDRKNRILCKGKHAFSCPITHFLTHSHPFKSSHFPPDQLISSGYCTFMF